MLHRRTAEDNIVDAVIGILIIVVIAITLYPFLNALAISLNHPDDTTRGGVTIFPRIFTTRNYTLIISCTLISQNPTRIRTPNSI